MILLCYDGSPDSRSAVDRAGELMPGEPATVLTVWEPFIEVITRTGAGMAYWPDGAELDQIDSAAEQSARHEPTRESSMLDALV
jgi:hypothetical protein